MSKVEVEIGEPAGNLHLLLACGPGTTTPKRVVFQGTLTNIGKRPAMVYLPTNDFPRVGQPFRFPVFARNGENIGRDLSEPANPFRVHQTRDHDWTVVSPGGRLSIVFDRGVAELANYCRKGGGEVMVQWVVSDRLFSHNYHKPNAPRDGFTASGEPFASDDPRLAAKNYWHAAYADRVIGRSNGLTFRLDADDRLVMLLEPDPANTAVGTPPSE